MIVKRYKDISRKKWTKEECQKEALKYKTRNSFIKGNRKAYRSATNNGWLDDICSHMISPYNKFNYWTKDRCSEEALKYSTRRQFMLNSKFPYNKSLRNGWLDDICSHMKTSGHKYKRCIYAVEFPDNRAYIGLTYNIDVRFHKHLTDPLSTVFKYKKLTGLIPIIKKLSDYIDVEDASKLESVKRDEYDKNGWIILNLSKCGNVGGKFIKWTKDLCQEEALKYNTRNEFKLKSPLAYHATRRNKWIDDVCGHMVFAYDKARQKKKI